MIERIALELRENDRLRKAIAATALLGLVAKAVAGWRGVAIVSLAVAIGAAFRPLRQRLARWWLLR